MSWKSFKNFWKDAWYDIIKVLATIAVLVVAFSLLYIAGTGVYASVMGIALPAGATAALVVPQYGWRAFFIRTVQSQLWKLIFIALVTLAACFLIDEEAAREGVGDGMRYYQAVMDVPVKTVTVVAESAGRAAGGLLTSLMTSPLGLLAIGAAALYIFRRPSTGAPVVVHTASIT